MPECSISQLFGNDEMPMSKNSFTYVLEVARTRKLLFYEMMESTLKPIKDESIYNRFIKSLEKKGAKQMNYRGKNHQKLFKSILSHALHMDKVRLAALYLLTADSHLWSYVKDSVGKYSIDFKKIRLGSINSDAYVLFMVAKDLCLGTSHIGTTDFSDRGVIREPIFKIIVNALTIARYGKDAVTAMERQS